MERRNFIKTALLGSVAAAVSFESNMAIASSKLAGSASAENDLVAVMGDDPVKIYRKGIEAMGGMKRFVNKGQKVTVKPNIGWDKSPELAGNTNPDLVKAIIEDCYAAGAKDVVVFDHTCDEWKACYKNSGIEDAVKKAGGRMTFAHDEKYYREVELPQAKNLKTAKIHQDILDCDVWINVPVLKNHGGAKMTIAMKNLMGIVWDRGFFHKNDLQQCIADSCTLKNKPVLNIVDAYRVMTQNGPRGKGPEDVQQAGAIFLSTDIVAVDTAAVGFFNQFKEMNLDIVSHIDLGQQAGIGTMDVSSLKVERIKL